MPDWLPILFIASYGLALALEGLGLWTRNTWQRGAVVATATLGAIAHSVHLTSHAVATSSTLGSVSDWYLLVAWVLVAVYLTVLFSRPGSAMGLFALPLVLGLLMASQWASHEPIASSGSTTFWGRLHGALLVLATVTTCLGFLSGIMYLIQSWRLKHKLPPSPRFRLPTLEWLERVNGRSLAVSAVLVAGGVVSGIVLARLAHREDVAYRWNADPVVMSLLLMLLWLIAAELFRVVYPAARRGRKVAYLTMATFGFLVIALITFAWNGSHGTSMDNRDGTQLDSPERRNSG
jgi:ABC-type uncharacterized transport system permease subunit